ncbi:DUF2179 domain-containing protein [Clostridium sartagoforme]|uniref:UPF0316 protein E5347_11235 n=1 Tax=Clostridium sartagoforme TaxID=84031 RepID=A0A4S2DJR9_9CLOT|nr:DUF5698 domain-containing protein [Clostridium sartagoforme]TGY41882.1 DUF2179 domain-containing protein [Clostridium sartagoforme]
MINALAIFILQLIYVPLLTLRTTFVVKGKKVQASLFAFLEAIIYIVSLGIVFSDLKNFLNIGSYILGYGIGVYIGGKIEEKLAIGYRSIHVNLTNYNEDLINKLRELRFGVTTYEGEGINKEKRYKLEIVSHRSRENEVISLIQSFEKNAFIVSYEPTQFRGGYITKQLKKL